MGERKSDDPPLHFRTHVFVCTNRRPEGHPKGSCAARGSERLQNYMKARAKEMGIKNIRINKAGCLDRCEHGPSIVIYPEGAWYTAHCESDIDAILERHVAKDGRVLELMMAPEEA